MSTIELKLLDANAKLCKLVFITINASYEEICIRLIFFVKKDAVFKLFYFYMIINSAKYFDANVYG